MLIRTFCNATEYVAKEFGHISKQFNFPNPYIPPRQAWIQTLKSVEDKKLGIIDLHPDVFATMPRIDIIKSNVQWQLNYRRIDMKNALALHEVPGSLRKPWPQKGTGRARQGNRKGPHWNRGASAHGPRAPKSQFYIEQLGKRLIGLCSTLSIKFVQDDVHIVDDLEIPTDDPEFLRKVVDERDWGLSVLFVDNTDFMPKNIAFACSKIPEYNLLPVYGLNVLMMLKHETLILTRAALEQLEHKLIQRLNTHEERTKAPLREPENVDDFRNY